MNLFLLLLAALGGAGIMYLTDPQTGNRRRVMLREQLNKAMQDTSVRINAAQDELRTRSQNVLSEAREQLDRAEAESEKLVQRIRSELGHSVNHPKGITVTAENGRVTLRGNVYAHEQDSLINAVMLVPGVHEVVNEMVTYSETDESIRGS